MKAIITIDGHPIEVELNGAIEVMNPNSKTTVGMLRAYLKGFDQDAEVKIDAIYKRGDYIYARFPCTISDIYCHPEPAGDGTVRIAGLNTRDSDWTLNYNINEPSEDECTPANHS